MVVLHDGERIRFKYEMLYGRVRYVIDSDDGRCRNVLVDANGVETPLRPHGKHGLWKNRALYNAVALGFSKDFGDRFLRLFEDESIPKVYKGGANYVGTVRLEDDYYDITVNVLNRQIDNVARSVSRYASAHAIARAKERYDITLDYHTAKDLVDRYFAKDYTFVSQNAGGTTVVIDSGGERFTVVMSHGEPRIITVLPAQK